MKYFIANWKANKNLAESLDWVNKFLSIQPFFDRGKVVLCPPDPLLYAIKEKIKNFNNISLGTQDVSKFEQGTYTGEVTAKTLQGLVDYAIIGHSERIKNFAETYSTNLVKVNLALKYNIQPLWCTPNENTKIPTQVKFIVYEPPWAISKGLEDSLSTKIEETPEKVIEVRKKLSLTNDQIFIYGGSVNSENIKLYSQYSDIDGVLVGGASLDPFEFGKIVNSSLH